jgi:hypothetical protein
MVHLDLLLAHCLAFFTCGKKLEVMEMASAHVYYEGVSTEVTNAYKLRKTKLRGFIPQANYTDRATAAFRRS